MRSIRARSIGSPGIEHVALLVYKTLCGLLHLSAGMCWLWRSESTHGLIICWRRCRAIGIGERCWHCSCWHSSSINARRGWRSGCRHAIMSICRCPHRSLLCDSLQLGQGCCNRIKFVSSVFLWWSRLSRIWRGDIEDVIADAQLISVRSGVDIGVWAWLLLPGIRPVTGTKWRLRRAVVGTTSSGRSPRIPCCWSSRCRLRRCIFQLLAAPTERAIKESALLLLHRPVITTCRRCS